MDYTIDQVLDIELLQSIQDKLNEINPFPSALIDPMGRILTATAWQDICTKFHRVHPESEKECIISDQYIRNHLDKANPAVSYTCPHGLVDNAIPIIVEGKHLANFFTGQFFLEPPDLVFFRKQAKRFGFDEDAYIQAVNQVPIWDIEKRDRYLEFGKSYIESMAEMGLARLREDEANRKARESEQRFQSVFEKMIEGFALHEIICDSAGNPVDYRFLDVNPAFEKVLGLKADQIVGKTALEILPGLDVLWVERFGQVALTGEPVTFEQYEHVQDKYFRVVAFSTQTGQFATIFDDVTDDKKAEQELRDSEDKYRQLADLSPEGILIHVNNTIQYANNSAARIMNAGSPEELLGKRVTDFVHPDYIPMVKERIAEIVDQKGTVPIIEEKLVRLTGESFFSEVSAVPFDLKGSIAVQVIFNDITKRKQEQEKLRILAQAIDCIGECVSMTDSENDILFVNKAFCKTYGYTSDELIGKNINMVRGDAGHNDSELREILSRTLGGGWSGEIENRKKDGTIFPVHISTAIVFDANGRTVALIGIATDITETRKNQKELMAAKEMAEESDRLKSAFLANISHEIRTPMNSILGFSELLEDLVDDPKQLEYLKIISAGGERLLNIINSVIDIAKIEAGEIDLVHSEFDIQDLMKELYELNRLRNRNINFQLERPTPGPLLFYSDKTKLFQILNNLVSNALKFTLMGSVNFGYHLESGSVLFFVKDTGIGIDEEFKSKIFKRFHKAKSLERAGLEGTGLGLAITRELVVILGGEIWFESELGRGTTFFVKFPRSQE